MPLRSFTIATILLPIACAAAFAADRVAVIPVGKGDANKLAPLVEISLQQNGMELVERSRLDDVLKEQQLDRALVDDAAKSRTKLGQLLKADYLVFVRTFDQPTPHLQVTTCEAAQGIRLSNPTYPRTKAEQDASSISNAVVKSIAKAKHAGYRIISVAPWDSDDFTQRFDYRRAVFRQLVQETLEQRDDVVLVEFNEAEALATELAIGGQANLQRKLPLMVKGRMKHSTMKADAKVRLSLEIDNGRQKVGSWNSVEEDPKQAAEQLPAAATDLLNKALGDNPSAPPKVEAAQLASHGRELLKFGAFADAYELLETAILLKPEDAALRGDAFRALAAQIEAELKEPLASKAGHDERDALLREYAKANAQRVALGLDHLEYYLAHTSIAFQQGGWDYVSARWLTTLAVPADVREMNYRVLKYKFDHQVKDSYAWLCCQLIQNENSIGLAPKLTLDEATRYVARMADVWVNGQLKWTVWSFYYAATLGYHTTVDTPEVQRMLARMEASPNPEAHSGAEAIRKELTRAEKPAVAAAPPARAPAKDHAPATQPADVVCESIPIPIDDILDFGNWAPAGPHADLFFGQIYAEPRPPASRAGVAYYFREDGRQRALPHFAGRYGPVYDGRFIWLVGDDGKSMNVYAYDTQADRILTAGSEQGVPPDAIDSVCIVALKQGSVCIAASVGEPPTRSWVATASTDGAAAPAFKVILEGKDRVLPPDFDGPLSAAFQPQFGCVLPGPPGAGEKATDQIYIGRGLNQMLLVDVNTFACTLGSSKKFWNPGRYYYRGGNPTVWQGKLYDRLRIWDPRSDTCKVLTTPRPLRPQGSAAVIYGTNYFVFDGENLFTGPIGEPLHALQLSYSREKDRNTAFQGSLAPTAMFGLIADGNYLLHLSKKVSPLAAPTVTYEDWIKRRTMVTSDAASYLALADLAERRGDEEMYVQAKDQYFAHAPRTLDRARREVDLADRLMRRGDYRRARKYADDAAETGAEWAIQSSGYVAEGLGDWARAERLAKDAADSYDNKIGWFEWCCRTGHGDLAAATAQAAAAAVAGEASNDREGIADAAVYYMLSGQKEKAARVLHRLYTEKGDIWAALHAAMYAAESEDTKLRDEILATTVPFVAREAGSNLQYLAQQIKEAFQTGRSLDAEKVEKYSNTVDQGELPNFDYFIGRYLLFHSEKDRGISYLKKTAGLNTHKSVRALAAQHLRSLGVEPPKPGQVE